MELVLPAPLPHQIAPLEHPARFKVGRCGRRWGKSRSAVLASVAGHGPGRCWRGVMQGGVIAWVGPDYKQTAAIWREELRPRFAGLPWATVRESERRIEVPALGGALEVLSAENIDALRGRKLDGVVVDEGAHLDLEYAWTAVIRPALADRMGWALFISSPNAGHDGNSEKRTPSFFNRLVSRIEGGTMGPEWMTWHGRSDDNPTLPPGEVAAMRAEYPDGSPTVQQEIDALLVAGGLLALPELDTAKHLIPPADVPRHWFRWGGFDWGYAHPAVFTLWAADEGGSVVLVDAVTCWKCQPNQIAERVEACLTRHGLTFQDLAYTAAGRDVFSEMKARGEYGPTLYEQFQAYGWTMIPANTARVHGLNNLRQYLRGSPVPRCRFMETAGGRAVWETLTGLVTDPDDPEDVLKQDADQNGKGGDDAYDAVRYALMARPLMAQPVAAVRHEDQADQRLPGQPVPQVRYQQPPPMPARAPWGVPRTYQTVKE